MRIFASQRFSQRRKRIILANVLFVMSICAFFAPFPKPPPESSSLTANRIFEAALVFFSASSFFIWRLVSGIGLRRIPLCYPFLGTFIFVSVISGIFCSRPLYSIEKVVELCLVIFIGVSYAERISNEKIGRGGLPEYMSICLFSAVIYTLLSNVYIYGTPFHFSEGIWVRENRLSAVYAHPLAYADLLCLYHPGGGGAKAAQSRIIETRTPRIRARP